ncbi:N-acetylmannosaminyltransferase [Hypnocyclicus thermotrophus]|uniref:N-acetylmannosaminyltransferase n=1 Tax=Hypnocyclicus thermotrophus TaxID=1627895 RepID=A0AA46E0E7_9FUSO|nr:WecB/TagA/CpsF family glycosyltransferase [Hypnocyclicus thermotrophus]TDT72451.1 N-acetylmannosaminyltransferase [Hypnocyclicus thermotrophus]
MDEITLVNDLKITGFESYNELFNEILLKKNIQNFLIINYMYWVPFVKARKDKDYLESLKYSGYILPDGVGLLTYIKVLYGKTLLNLNGTDLNPELIKFFNDKNMKIALYGTTQENIEKCVKSLNSKNIDIYYYQNGYRGLDFSKIEDNSVLFVGKGSPIQEIWVKNNFKTIKEKKLIVVTVGGYFDFEAGFYKRAPKFIRDLKSEWIYRILDNPKLQIPKYINNFYFPWFIFKDYIKLKKKVKEKIYV